MVSENKERIAAQEGIPTQFPAIATAVEEEGMTVMLKQAAHLYGAEGCLNLLQQGNSLVGGHFLNRDAGCRIQVAGYNSWSFDIWVLTLFGI